MSHFRRSDVRTGRVSLAGSLYGACRDDARFTADAALTCNLSQQIIIASLPGALTAVYTVAGLLAAVEEGNVPEVCKRMPVRLCLYSRKSRGEGGFRDEELVDLWLFVCNRRDAELMGNHIAVGVDFHDLAMDAYARLRTKAVAYDALDPGRLKNEEADAELFTAIEEVFAAGVEDGIFTQWSTKGDRVKFTEAVDAQAAELTRRFLGWREASDRNIKDAKD